VASLEELASFGAATVNTREPQLLLEGSAYVSGEIKRVTAFERGFPGQYRQSTDGSGWVLDELMMDERFLAVNIAGKGLVIFSACSHAGVINVLTHAKSSLPGVPIHAVVGGLHLVGQNERIIPKTVEALASFELATIAAGHCTGWRAMNALANAFGDSKIVPLSVGKRISF
jgi:7,8-dihydropterin-6-yl-methyl-4-(beta-D-ribofuranosyl)aminobenzene 5'-phosphate synthase